jgi:hypothetical protein
MQNRRIEIQAAFDKCLRTATQSEQLLSRMFSTS